MEKITITDYPFFIKKEHVIKHIQKTDKKFSNEVKKHNGSFTFEKVYFTNGMNDYLLAIPFNYKGDTLAYGKEITKDFNSMKDGE